MKANDHLITSGRWGIEKEAHRIDPEGNLSPLPHPFPPSEGQITVDFAESQTELVTGIHPNILSAYLELSSLQERLISALDPREQLWPLAVPVQKHLEQYALASFGGDPNFVEERAYRQKLFEKHSLAVQLQSGVHINFSHNLLNDGDSLLALSREVWRFKPLFSWLFGSSPKLFANDPIYSGAKDPCLSFTSSLRQSRHGYGRGSADASWAMYNDSVAYEKGLEHQLQGGKLITKREFYAPIRLRQSELGPYLEFRFFDLNPLANLGLSQDTALFFALALEVLSTRESRLFTESEFENLLKLDHAMNSCSLSDKRLRAEAKKLFDKIDYDLKKVATSLGGQYLVAYDWAKDTIHKKRLRLSEAVTRGFEGPEPTEKILKGSALFRDFHKLELSTQILIHHALERGYEVRLLDSRTNTIEIKDGTKKEILIQATRTSADSYVAPLVSENKNLTKQILKEAGVKVPEGSLLEDVEQPKTLYESLWSKKIVVKPNSTNFGDGVTILESGFSLEAFSVALSRAGVHDQAVLVEEFSDGTEFRFLVIGGKTVAVLEREPAHVVGDGSSSITELVELKNQNPLRGTGYKRPLEKLALGDIEVDYLANQGLDQYSIPQLGQRIYLRQNSNISTGGDSIDHTESMHETYKAVAERASEALGLKISGVDMIIPSYVANTYTGEATVLELNYNPALHIHSFPSQGSPQDPAGKVLDLLGFVVKPSCKTVHCDSKN